MGLSPRGSPNHRRPGREAWRIARVTPAPASSSGRPGLASQPLGLRATLAGRGSTPSGWRSASARVQFVSSPAEADRFPHPVRHAASGPVVFSRFGAGAFPQPHALSSAPLGSPLSPGRGLLFPFAPPALAGAYRAGAFAGIAPGCSPRACPRATAPASAEATSPRRPWPGPMRPPRKFPSPPPGLGASPMCACSPFPMAPGAILSRPRTGRPVQAVATLAVQPRPTRPGNLFPESP